MYSFRSAFSHASNKKNEIIIVVMGPTGAGKSTFINYLLGEEKMKVGNELTSCTSKISAEDIRFEDNEALRGLNITIVDTPGFDDTYLEDAAILKNIATWLEKAYRQRRNLGGVIYLHNISNNRFSGTMRRNLELFNHLCGDRALTSVILGVTHISKMKEGELAKPLDEMMTKHWSSMIEKGSEVAKFEDSRDSAVEIIEKVIRKRLCDTCLQIQAEIVDNNKSIPETKAGQQLRYTLQEMLDYQRRTLSIDKNIARSGDVEAKRNLLEGKARIEKMEAQIKDLKIPMSRKLKNLFRFL